MRTKTDYFFEAFNAPLHTLIDLAYKIVFRKEYSYSGFIVFDFGKHYTSSELRQRMVDIKNGLGDCLIRDKNLKLNYQWMGRFNQQETTKFHRDSAADQSFLMLGYEPSKIKSRLFFADYMQLATSLNLSPDEYFQQYSPILLDNEKHLDKYITEVEDFDETTYKIVLMNNSCSVDTLGVLHKASIVNKDTSIDRIINSTMLVTSSIEEQDSFTPEQQKEFIFTDIISRNLR
jgi:hypothetical protein